MKLMPWRFLHKKIVIARAFLGLRVNCSNKIGQHPRIGGRSDTLMSKPSKIARRKSAFGSPRINFTSPLPSLGAGFFVRGDGVLSDNLTLVS
jgi:hypothetical protein